MYQAFLKAFKETKIPDKRFTVESSWVLTPSTWFEESKICCRVSPEGGGARGCNSEEEVVVLTKENLELDKTVTCAVHIHARYLERAFFQLIQSMGILYLRGSWAIPKQVASHLISIFAMSDAVHKVVFLFSTLHQIFKTGKNHLK